MNKIYTWLQSKLVSNWRQSWRWFSQQIPAANSAFLLVWANLPSKFQEAFPVQWVLAVAIILIVLGMIGRMIDQTPKDTP